MTFPQQFEMKKGNLKKKEKPLNFSVGHSQITFGFFLKASPGVDLFI